MENCVNNSELENVTGGSRDSEGYYGDMCGRHADVETFEIRIDYRNPKVSVYLGKKDVCHKCRNTLLEEYIAKNGWNEVDGIYMRGPL